MDGKKERTLSQVHKEGGRSGRGEYYQEILYKILKEILKNETKYQTTFN